LKKQVEIHGESLHWPDVKNIHKTFYKERVRNNCNDAQRGRKKSDITDWNEGVYT
jgi:hypothetical protein